MVHGDRRLGGAGGDQLELTRVGRDVTRREHPGDVRLHRLRHLDLALFDVEAPVGDCPERGDEAELRNHAVDGDTPSSFVLLLKIVTASIASPPWIAFSSQKVRSSIFPAAHSSCTCRTVAA